MVIMGIDPGLERTGFGVIKYEHGKATLVDFGRIRTSKTLPLSERLNEVAGDCKKLILQHRPDAAVFEEIFFSKNVKTAMKVSHSRGVLMEVFADFGIPIHEMNPGAIKLSLTGFGRADKNQIQQMVKTLLNMKEKIQSDDAADALAAALAFTHINPALA